jgi:sugar-specific transcriptional regulator TrmB
MLQNNILEKSLQELGLSNFQIQLYSLLIKKEDLNIMQLAKELGVYRLKVYDALEELKQFNLIQKESNYSRKIIIEPPSKIITLLKRKETELSTLNTNLSEYLPTLQNEYYSSRKQPIIKVYEGKTQFINIFHQILEELEAGDEICIIGEGQDFYDIIDFEYYYSTFREDRIKRVIKAKVLWKQPILLDIKKLISTDSKELRKSKTLPTNFSSPGSIWITKNKVINWTTVLPKAIVIQDQNLVLFYNELFESYWNILD